MNWKIVAALTLIATPAVSAETIRLRCDDASVENRSSKKYTLLEIDSDSKSIKKVDFDGVKSEELILKITELDEDKIKAEGFLEGLREMEINRLTGRVDWNWHHPEVVLPGGKVWKAGINKFAFECKSLKPAF